MRGIVAGKATKTYRVDLGATPITTGAYLELDPRQLHAASAVEIFNPSASTIKIAEGAAGSEVDLPYTILPGGSSILPLELHAGARLSVKAVDANAVANIFTLNCFG